MISVTLSQLTDILNGELQGADITLDAVTTDTRKLTPGCRLQNYSRVRLYPAHRMTLFTRQFFQIGFNLADLIGYY